MPMRRSSQLTSMPVSLADHENLNGTICRKEFRTQHLVVRSGAKRRLCEEFVWPPRACALRWAIGTRQRAE